LFALDFYSINYGLQIGERGVGLPILLGSMLIFRVGFVVVSIVGFRIRLAKPPLSLPRGLIGSTYPSLLVRSRTTFGLMILVLMGFFIIEVAVANI
jgi:hypothetical protein